MKRLKRYAAMGLGAILTILLIGYASAQARVTLAYISDSPSSSVPFWVAKETGLFAKHGLDIDMLFINGSTRGIHGVCQSVPSAKSRCMSTHRCRQCGPSGPNCR